MKPQLGATDPVLWIALTLIAGVTVFFVLIVALNINF